jgi:anti-sigma regulatory factor (Ser/Thr protein kinase)
MGPANEESTHLSSHPTSAGAARRFVAQVLGRWRCTGEVADAVLLCTDELVTNAILHVGSDIDVVVRHECEPGSEAVRVEVSDASPRPPLRRVVAPEDETGHGLTLVEALADRWGVEVKGPGKVVWFRVHLAPAQVLTSSP